LLHAAETRAQVQPRPVFLFIYLFIYTQKIISKNMLKNYYKKYPNIIRYKNQLIYMTAMWEPKE